MREELKELLKRSKSLYFNYPVACILECVDGRKFYGVNVETSSPASGICAERNAIFSAIANGYNKEDFVHMYLTAKTDKELFPCFICRQTLIEYCNKSMPITCFYKDSSTTVTVEELTPYSFSGDDLK